MRSTAGGNGDRFSTVRWRLRGSRRL